MQLTAGLRYVQYSQSSSCLLFKQEALDPKSRRIRIEQQVGCLMCLIVKLYIKTSVIRQKLSRVVNFLLRRGSEDVAKQTNQPNHNSLPTKYCSTIEFSDIFMYFPSSSNFTNSISTEPQNAIN